MSDNVSSSNTVENLANQLACKARSLRMLILEELDPLTGNPHLINFHHEIKSHMLPSLDEKAFAEAYAQALVFGLFFVLNQHNGQRSRVALSQKASNLVIQSMIQLIEDTIHQFHSPSQVGSSKLHSILVDCIAILQNADHQVLIRKNDATNAVHHFHEAFLHKYSRKQRKIKGVYFTPRPIAQYIVRSIHEILKDDLHKTNGLANDSVTVLDPAAGTMTFTIEAIRIIREDLETQAHQRSFEQVIEDHILKKFYAFEIQMASYLIGYLRISLVLEENGYQLQTPNHIQLFLTNTLEHEANIQPILSPPSDLRNEEPLLVVYGNPPYFGRSKERSEFIDGLMRAYLDPVRSETNLRPLHNDYIKFIRFAEWKIQQFGNGILGFITDSSYLDGPVFRGMRKHLLEQFDQIYIMNLHGNSRTRLHSPDGRKDENVFDIKQGVAIGIFIKSNELRKKVRYMELWGTRKEKFDFLDQNTLSTTNWQVIEPSAPNYFLIPFDTPEQYASFVSLLDIFNKQSEGVKTHRDRFVIDITRQALDRRMMNFADRNIKDEEIKERLGLKDSKYWKVKRARELVRRENHTQTIKPYHFRPFDFRWLYYSSSVINRPREAIMQNLLPDRNNLALVVPRRIRTETWAHILVSDKITHKDCLSDVDTNRVFPLYLYEETGKRSNVRIELREKLAKQWKQVVESEKVFYYIYAILFSPSYRLKYQAPLKAGFPRIPFPEDFLIFDQVSGIGKQLVEWHLLKNLKEAKVEFPYLIAGNDEVIRREIRYNSANDRIYINSTQFFANVPIGVWSFTIGRFQVIKQWLEGRSGRTLDLAEIDHFKKILQSIRLTINILDKLDVLYTKIDSI